MTNSVSLATVSLGRSATVGSVTSRQRDVLVIGAGVSGLTTAVCLAEAGCSVTVAAAQRAPLITSAAAGAIWGPHLVGIDERVTRWGAVTLARFAELATDPASGVHLASGVAASADQRAEPFGWVSALGSASPCGPADLPDGYPAGWRLTAPIVSMPVYLGYLMARLDRAGGQLREAEFGSLAEAAAQTTAPVIVNCSGIGARRLVPDLDVRPVRGQVVVTENPGLSEFFIGVGADPGEVSYYFPHGDVAVLGGTEEMGNWSLEPDPATAERILRACAAVQPRLRGATAAEHRVGLRPWRPSVRLEAEALDGGRTLVHNYGHGGAGVTLSWGCALEVAASALG
jgi:D-amino-acid oxidase